MGRCARLGHKIWIAGPLDRPQVHELGTITRIRRRSAAWRIGDAPPWHLWGGRFWRSQFCFLVFILFAASLLFQVVGSLKVDPELRARSEKLTDPESRPGSDPPLT